MRSTKSKISATSQKTTGNDYEFEIAFVPLPDEKRAEWQMAMELLNEILLKAIAEHEEQQLAISSQQLAVDNQNLENLITGSDERRELVPLRP